MQVKEGRTGGVMVRKNKDTKKPKRQPFGSRFASRFARLGLTEEIPELRGHVVASPRDAIGRRRGADARDWR